MRKLFSFLLFLSVSYLSLAQNCFNASIESGTLNGFTPYIGKVNSLAEVTLEEQKFDSTRQRIMHISEGYDTVALAHCEINQLLPVVPEGGGQYTVRLGNANIGAEVDLIGMDKLLQWVWSQMVE